MYSKRRHMEEQEEFEECNRIGRRLWKEILHRERKGSKVTKDRWRSEDV